MIDMFYLPPVVGVLGLIVALVLYRLILKRPAGDAKVTGIADQIHLGAMVFMRREYTMLGMFSAVLLAVILFSPLGVHTALAFLVGALCSASASGMPASTLPTRSAPTSALLV